MGIKGIPMLRIDAIEAELSVLPYYTPHAAVSKKVLELGLE